MVRYLGHAVLVVGIRAWVIVDPVNLKILASNQREHTQYNTCRLKSEEAQGEFIEKLRVPQGGNPRRA